MPEMNVIDTKEVRHANMTAIAPGYYKRSTSDWSVVDHNLT
jgi:hypothetical protein